MTILFSQKTLPESNSSTYFGFIQRFYSPTNFIEHSEEIPRCPKCDCYLFPTKENNLKCPNCETNADFINNSIHIGPGFETTNFFIFIFDLSLPLDQTQTLLNQIYDKMSDNSKILILSLSGQTTLIFSKNDIPQFTTYTDFSDFHPYEFHFTSKSDLKSIIMPSLTALYSIFSKFDQKPQDILTVLKICISFGRPALLLCFLKREIAAISVDSASKISRALAKVGISANFVATQNFRRLTALSRFSFGIVISFSVFSTTILDKLLSPSATGPYSLKVIMPRGVEILRVAGADGSVNMTSSLITLQFQSARGCSALIERSSDRFGSNLKNFFALELATTVFGQFLTLHRFDQGLDSENSNEKHILPMIAIQLKIISQTVLKVAWNGEKIENALAQCTKNPVLSGTCLANTGIRGDKDILKFYYTLNSLYNEINITTKKFKNGQIILSPPIISIFSTDPLEEVLPECEKLCTTEWPFEICFYNNYNEFEAIANSMGIQLEQ